MKIEPYQATEFTALQDGNYSASLWFQMFVAWIDQRWPGAGEWIETAANVIPWDKLLVAVTNAIADWSEGKSFIQILREAIEEWVTIMPDPSQPLGVMMVAKEKPGIVV